jgi:hypothetical protein
MQPAADMLTRMNHKVKDFSMRVKYVNTLMSQEEAFDADLLERYRYAPARLTEKQLARVKELLGEVDPDSYIEQDMKGFAASITSREEMYGVYNQYSDPSWLSEVSQAYAMALCSVLRALAAKFGFPDNDLWKRYDISTAS